MSYNGSCCDDFVSVGERKKSIMSSQLLTTKKIKQNNKEGKRWFSHPMTQCQITVLVVMKLGEVTSHEAGNSIFIGLRL